MKQFLAAILLAASLGSASASIIISNYYTPTSGLIPDNNPSGWTDTRTISGYSGYTVTDVNVVLNISGGWNGDLYGYLVHDSGFAVLLDRVGKTITQPFGYSNSGFSITLDDSASPPINTVGSYSSSAPVVGTYASQGGTLSSFNGTPVNGSWTLFLADLSFGDMSTVDNWSLVITAVPEPTTWAALIFGGLFGAVQVARRFRKA